MKLSLNKIILLVIAVIVVVLVMMSSKQAKTPVKQSVMSHQDLASGDTNNEVIRELTAKYQEMVAINKRNDEHIKQLMQQAKGSASTQDTAVITKLKTEQAQTAAKLSQVESEIAENKTSQSKSKPDYQIASQNTEAPQVIGTVQDLSDQINQTNTLSNVMHQGSDLLSHNESLLLPPSQSTSTSVQDNEPASSSKTPMYTIPALSNLANTSLMTALIGEVPSGNNFEQPLFPFEAIIGRKQLLAANGIPLPSNLSGMKISGYSVGVGSFMQGISCVRSYITQVLFVFNDGHFSVVGQANTTSNNTVDPSQTLGYLSDIYGNPCMRGKYITNAPRVLALLTGVGIVDGVGQGLAQSQTTTLTGFNGASTVFNGNVSKYALGYGLSYSTNKAVDYMLDRLKGTFDVVYIPASSHGVPTHVVANFTHTVPIDYDKQGRKLRYANRQSDPGVTHTLD